VKAPYDLSVFLQTLRCRGELAVVNSTVDPYLEIPEIHRRVVAQNGPALLFTSVKGSQFAVATNLFGTQSRLLIACGEDIQTRIEQIVHNFPPSLSSLWSYRKLGTRRAFFPTLPRNEISPPNLEKIPFLTSSPDDGGAFLTLPLVYTESLDGRSKNLGMYRIQRHSQTTAGLHWQLGKGGGFHYAQAEKNQSPLPVTIFLGGPPALTLSAIAPLPENVSEVLLASFLLNDRLRTTKIPHHPHALFDDCECALLGYANPYERKLEGPFGDHYGYVDTAHPYPVFHCTKIVHKKNAIIPATVVGKPLQEDAAIGTFLQSLLKTFIPLLIPGILDLFSYQETGFHPLTAIRVNERYRKESVTIALRLLGEGQLSFTKVLFVLNDSVPLDNFKLLLPHLLERCLAEDILVLPTTPSDTLDMTGPTREVGSKVIFFASAHPKRSLPVSLSLLPLPVKHQAVFTPGCLLIDGPSYEELLCPESLLSALSSWPLTVLVDDVSSITSPLEFLWQTFTRFEPARDIYGHKEIQRNGVVFSGPILIDARMKPPYQQFITSDPFTQELVTARWHEYFS
jgi:UbiD family decarboxylase